MATPPLPRAWAKRFTDVALPPAWYLVLVPAGGLGESPSWLRHRILIPACRRFESFLPSQFCDDLTAGQKMRVLSTSALRAGWGVAKLVKAPDFARSNPSSFAAQRKHSPASSGAADMAYDSLMVFTGNANPKLAPTWSSA
jgi:hypothetical protein